MTEERFLTYYKCLNTKLNHIINLLKDRSTEVLVDEGENLLPNFPLKTVQEFEQFQRDLIESLEIQKLYVRSFVITYLYNTNAQIIMMYLPLFSQIREIKMIGGSDAGKFTRATLRFLISNQLALQYSWSGQKNTRKFQNTLISQLIVGELIGNILFFSIQGYSNINIKLPFKISIYLITKFYVTETISKIKNVPKSDIETIIKKWLQHASDRLKNQKQIIS